MKPVVVRNIKRADPNAVGTLQAAGVSTAHEALGRSGLMKPYMRPIYAGAQIAGPAVTVLAQPGDNWMIHVAVEQCQKGDVLVVGCTADNGDGMFGELLATALVARGVIGLVIDAGCRDVKPLHEMSFPVWSRASACTHMSMSTTIAWPGTFLAATKRIIGLHPSARRPVISTRMPRKMQ